MTLPLSKQQNIEIRPLQLRDFEALETLIAQHGNPYQTDETLVAQLEQFRRWYGLLKVLRLLPNPSQHQFHLYVAEQGGEVRGLIEVSPFNRTRSTWQVERVLVDLTQPPNATVKDVGSQLLRYCFETIWEARTWLLEVNVNDKQTMALYRQNGFQPLAQMTYWEISPELLSELAEREPALPNLLPVSNADAQLLYQLDTVSMPPLLRQVFDRHITDFKTPLLRSLVNNVRHWGDHQETVTGYVFEPQRKAAIAYFELQLSPHENTPNEAQLTVHPAYTWLYPELITQMSRIVKEKAFKPLRLASADYQPEREEYLEKLGAERTEHTTLMSRSVWHKLRETKPLEALQLSDVLQGLQPARTPIPSRMAWFKSHHQNPNNSTPSEPGHPNSMDNG
ncbi:GNAT family N-acetyltransferase [Spirulina sp. CS-785/01]|uniref:GNAT family N-acetyltransferase n=1 Tax=Spirulina sp. CS-785/01 TaxID=3021716 RepID=UPI00232C0A1B|nr:GNAT family N-acetyltransferase [Spirulina sp. CS-785/01]MDB9311626.1 GNAT family N-acetyltransferase [Spirulina sp. CS-785/01]